METYIAKLLRTEYTLTKLIDVIDLKLVNLQERLDDKLDIPTAIIDGNLYEELIKLSQNDVESLHKFYIITKFIIKVENLRFDGGFKPVETSLPFFDGIVTAILSLLNDCLITVVYLISDLLVHVINYLSLPAVSTAIRSSKRLISTIFVSLSKASRVADFELPLLLSLKYLLSLRTYDYKKNEDLMHLSQLRKLQLSSNDNISKDSSELIAINLIRLYKRNESYISNFLATSVKYMNDELDSSSNKVVYFRLSRTIEMLIVMFDKNIKSRNGIKVVVTDLWNVLDRILTTMKENQTDLKLFNNALKIIKIICNSIDGDLILINIKRISNLFNSIYSGDNLSENLVTYGDEICEILELISLKCSDFYMALDRIYDFSKGVIMKCIEDDDNSSDVFKTSIKLLYCTIGYDRSIDVESLIMKIINSSYNNIMDLNPILKLILKHIKTGSSNHHLLFNSILNFINKINGNRNLINEIHSEIYRKLQTTHNNYSNSINYQEYSNKLQDFINLIKHTTHKRPSTEVQSNYIRPADSSPPEVQSLSSTDPLAVEASSNYLSLKSIATPRDRDCSVVIGPQVEHVADLREAQGEVNKESSLQEEVKVITSVVDDNVDEEDKLIIERIKRNLKRLRN